jgi:membrane-bound lytic murein transglycosylase MltF
VLPDLTVRSSGNRRQTRLDPNKWFDNVELMVAQNVGQTTINYVSNIYKYYVAYKLVLERLPPKGAVERKG